MKIERIETLQADGGGRTFDYLKVTADNGLAGWSEYNESFGGAGLPAVIDRLAPHLIGKDPRRYEAHVALLQALRRQAAGGLVQQAIAAIENALLDLKARALQVPVYELFGGPLRERIRLYWSHCGTYRVGPRARDLQVKPVNSLDDIVDLGKEVVLRGYSALKTNILLLSDGNPRGHTPGFARGVSVSRGYVAGYPFIGGYCPRSGALSAAETFHARIAYSRPRGNTEPDQDPGTAATALGEHPPLVIVDRPR